MCHAPGRRGERTLVVHALEATNMYFTPHWLIHSLCIGGNDNEAKCVEGERETRKTRKCAPGNIFHYQPSFKGPNCTFQISKLQSQQLMLSPFELNIQPGPNSYIHHRDRQNNYLPPTKAGTTYTFVQRSSQIDTWTLDSYICFLSHFAPFLPHHHMFCNSQTSSVYTCYCQP